ncbi:mannose-6-phosphate isomerase [Butyrivibrio sp. XB500-5]|uniref:type I phosphomannose isomerase catalytic subunit n=1 Tax=Butyrivibrio sp. XB500-5 TaxID=2364880 RepID=UPI000EA88782|nr:type I phosphomannose isomerase catalytic subunit [Butyrivibrio sp. XB500-5]RKM56058.1 mannose-6-phosphate isomerase [Butyrivibrio sp. XB500-5]
MGIYKLKPACKDYIWGGNRLVNEYGVECDGEICAEAWVLSCHKDGSSRITSDIQEGRLFSEFINENKAVLGTNCERFDDFPILIKLIDAKKPLSIQVHPDDEYALKHEKQFGKTEMWYVLEADEGAFLYQGFEKNIDKEEFERRINDNTLTEVLHKKYVKKGDVIFIAPGTLHAIGEGIMVAEIQQNSNVTYRVYDYGRLGPDGKPRELHISKALDVTKLERPTDTVSNSGHLATCEYFCVDKITVKKEAVYHGNAGKESFVSILSITGNCTVSTGTEAISMKKGDSLFIEADTGKYEIEGDAEVIITSIPSKA